LAFFDVRSMMNNSRRFRPSHHQHAMSCTFSRRQYHPGSARPGKMQVQGMGRLLISRLRRLVVDRIVGDAYRVRRVRKRVRWAADMKETSKAGLARVIECDMIRSGT